MSDSRSVHLQGHCPGANRKGVRVAAWATEHVAPSGPPEVPGKCHGIPHCMRDANRYFCIEHRRWQPGSRQGEKIFVVF